MFFRFSITYSVFPSFCVTDSIFIRICVTDFVFLFHIYYSVFILFLSHPYMFYKFCPADPSFISFCLGGGERGGGRWVSVSTIVYDLHFAEVLCAPYLVLFGKVFHCQTFLSSLVLCRRVYDS